MHTSAGACRGYSEVFFAGFVKARFSFSDVRASRWGFVLLRVRYLLRVRDYFVEPGSAPFVGDVRT
jgi:hypothetical protein